MKPLNLDIEHINEHGELGVYEYPPYQTPRFIGYTANNLQRAAIQFDCNGHLAVNYAEVLHAH